MVLTLSVVSLMKENTITLVINENDNIYTKLIDCGVDVAPLKKQLSMISAKMHNNKIGFARLSTAKGILKIIVCPKIFDYNESRYLLYIQKVFSLIVKYKQKKGLFKIDDTLLNVALLSESESNGLSFDSLLEYKFRVALIEIRRFFKRYNNRRARYQPFVSSSLSHNIDVLGSLTDPIKSNIHQTRKINVVDSKLAEIAVLIIETFIKKNKSYINPNLISEARQLHGEIKKSYNISNLKFKILDLFSNSTKKLFNNKSKKELFRNLITLLSQEDFFNTIQGEASYDNFFSSSSIFFEANSMFEYFVYESLINEYGCVKIKPIEYQSINSLSGGQRAIIKFEPDFIVDYLGRKIVVDAKWKILDSLNSSFYYDVLKIQRDAEIFNADQKILIYPKVSQSLLNDSPYFFGTRENDLIHVKKTEVI